VRTHRVGETYWRLEPLWEPTKGAISLRVREIGAALGLAPPPSLDSDPTLPSRTTRAVSSPQPMAFVAHDRLPTSPSCANLS
jgi:hypothetical protein